MSPVATAAKTRRRKRGTEQGGPAATASAPPILMVLVAGPLFLGLIAAFGNTVAVHDDMSIPAAAFAFAGNIGSSWALLAFAAGAVVPRAPIAVGASVFVLVAATLVYYTTIEAFGIRSGVDSISLDAARDTWLVASVGAGVVFGTAGYLWRTREGFLAAFAVGTVVASLLADFVLVDHWMAYVPLAGAPVAAAVLTRRLWPFAIAMVSGIVLAGVAATALSYVDEVARQDPRMLGIAMAGA